jgi:hypothetical protein
VNGPLDAPAAVGVGWDRAFGRVEPMAQAVTAIAVVLRASRRVIIRILLLLGDTAEFGRLFAQSSPDPQIMQGFNGAEFFAA